MEQELIQHFESYRDGFDQFDAEKISNHYLIPCAIIDGDGNQSYRKRSKLIQKFSTLCETFAGQKYSHSKFKIGDLNFYSSDISVIDLGWRVFFDASKQDFRCLYQCHQDQQQWRIFSAQAYAGPFDKT